MVTIKTVSDFKKALEIGALVHCIYHTATAGRDEKGIIIFKDEDKGVRPVSIKQSNSFALKTTRTDGKVVDSWCNYPKASECIIKNNSITILEEDFRFRDSKQFIPVLTYTIY